jgi:hypothetical protein
LDPGILLAPSGSFWLCLAPPGSSWIILARSGSFWLLLALSGSFWLLLAPSGSFWLLQHNPTVHCDYTYFSVEGTAICSSYEAIDRQKAIPVFVAYALRTGYAMAQQVSKKGADAHTIASMSLFLEELQSSEVVLRGDSENALQSLLRSVKESMTNVVKCEVQGTVTGSHQSIGAAEKVSSNIGRASTSSLC